MFEFTMMKWVCERKWKGFVLIKSCDHVLMRVLGSRTIYVVWNENSFVGELSRETSSVVGGVCKLRE